MDGCWIQKVSYKCRTDRSYHQIALVLDFNCLLLCNISSHKALPQTSVKELAAKHLNPVWERFGVWLSVLLKADTFLDRCCW